MADGFIDLRLKKTCAGHGVVFPNRLLFFGVVLGVAFTEQIVDDFPICFGTASMIEFSLFQVNRYTTIIGRERFILTFL